MNILHIENNPITALGLKTYIESEFENASVFHVSSVCDENQQKEKHEKIDLIIIEPNDIDGIIECVAEKYPTSKLLVFTAVTDTHFGLSSLLAGAKGYLHKGESPEMLKLAIKCVYSGCLFISSSLSDNLGVFIRDSRESLLSPREREVVKHLLNGKNQNKISQLLQLKPSTVATQKSRAFKKLGVANLIELSKVDLELY
jgi:DNA-binding NarL/FixJ family response regulator